MDQGNWYDGQDTMIGHTMMDLYITNRLFLEKQLHGSQAILTDALVGLGYLGCEKRLRLYIECTQKKPFVKVTCQMYTMTTNMQLMDEEST